MFLRFRSTRRLQCVALLLCGLVFAAAARADKSGSIGLREAIAQALAHNPDLATFEFEFRALDARRSGAALAPSTELAIGLENLAGTGEFRGVAAAEATFALSRVIELGGKPAARVAAVDAAQDALRTARQAAQLDVLAEVTRRFIALAALEQQQLLEERATALAERTLRAADRRVRAARAPHVEFDRASVALERARLERQAVVARVGAARRLLAAMWGADDALIDGRPFGATSGDLFALPAIGEFDTLMLRLQSSPDLLRFANEERLRDAELRLAVAQRRPDITVGGGVRRLQGSRDAALVLSVSVPLFAGRRAEAAIAEAASRRDAVGPSRTAALTRVRAQLHSLHAELREAEATVRVIEATIGPKMEEALKETEYAFERGRYGYLELADAQREYLETLRARIDAGAQAQMLANEIERLTNAPLATP
jgi:cobalt-zinc-cadmium efflux system outer membrane protein